MATKHLMLAVFIAAALNTSVHAARLNYRLGLSAEHSDNIARSSTTPVSDTVLAPWLGFAVTQDSEALSLQAAGDLEYRRYLDASFGPELRARAGLRGNWNIVPQRLSWAFEDVVSDQPINSFAADQPDNRQRANVLVTGPTLALRPSPRTRLLTELRYVNTHAERTTEFNSDRLNAAVRGLLNLSPRRVVSMNIEVGDIRFDTPSRQNGDYRRHDGFMRYNQRGSRGEWSMDAGATRLRFDATSSHAAGTETSPLLRLRGSFELTDISRIEASLQRQSSDAAQDLLDSAPKVEDYDLPIGLPDLRSGAVSADVFEESGISLGLSRRSESLYLRLDGYRREQAYQRSGGLDQSSRGLRAAMTRQLRTNLSLGLFATAEWRDFDTLGRDDRDTRLGLLGNWRWSRRLGVSAELSRSVRRSTDPTQPYDDNRLVVSISYVR
ncbi:MAG: outer membrane beta-barrel protein [Rhodanobacteraceae bacterium]|nr:outer membrane beta-barrel protein [Rhodanobacteraceae bacterium]